MKRISSHQGSALLIVIGMLAFMVVSAVAFSAYMRYSRQPSSYLRRSSASRQLIKAALASAIDDIDRAINKNPHPGLGNTPFNGQIGDDYDKGAQSNRNVWVGRVFMGTSEGEWLERVRKDNDETIFDETVPVLTLEGLAYIPPSLVNAARYYGRRTQTAMWQTFDFDAGRYAYVALDVSDYFDVNRLFADKGRSSASSRRITLSHVFEDSEGDRTFSEEGEMTKSSVKHERVGGAEMSSWDNFMKKFRDVKNGIIDFNSKLPLVSVADLNLALGYDNGQNFKSPFCKYIGQTGGGFYNSAQMDAKKIAQMTFITDSWFPTTQEDKEEVYDLTDANNQPFKMEDLMSEDEANSSKISMPNKANVETVKSGTKAGSELEEKLSADGMVALWDYLDTDRVPVSLAHPTLERTPMCCGIKPEFGGSFFVKDSSDGTVRSKPEDGADPAGNTAGKNGEKRTVYQKFKYEVDMSKFKEFLGQNSRAYFVYPFAHADGMPSINGHFKIDGCVRVYFSESPTDVTRSGSGSSECVHLADKNPAKGLDANGVLTIRLKNKEFKFDFGSAETEKDFCKEVEMEADDSSFPAEIVLKEVWYTWEQTYSELSKSWEPSACPKKDIESSRYDMPPLTSDGMKGEKVPKADLKKEAKLYAAVYLWVTDTKSSNMAVDLVPALDKDDMTFNKIENSRPTICGSKWPVLRFETGVTVNFEGEIAAGEQTYVLSSPKALWIKDPRYNYLPEAWETTETWSVEEWVAFADDVSETDGDPDIFMATSDQGYLQSIYELAFLPRLTDLSNSGNNYSLTTEGNGYGTFGKNLMGRTYNVIYDDKIEALPFVSAGSGFKVNPYTDSLDIMVAAFANTPIDWTLSSSNNALTVKMSAEQFNTDYAWNEYGSEVGMEWKDLERLASKYIMSIGKIKDRREGMSKPVSWKDAWYDMWQDGKNDGQSLCGIDLSDTSSKIWSVDRKFFYGFWRDCFAAKQQLFLVFLRAEPNLMGGRGQLGGRAVALVWRDPAPGVDYPHRTRVLFYRPLD